MPGIVPPVLWRWLSDPTGRNVAGIAQKGDPQYIESNAKTTVTQAHVSSLGISGSPSGEPTRDPETVADLTLSSKSESSTAAPSSLAASPQGKKKPKKDGRHPVRRPRNRSFSRLLLPSQVGRKRAQVTVTVRGATSYLKQYAVYDIDIACYRTHLIDESSAEPGSLRRWTVEKRYSAMKEFNETLLQHLRPSHLCTGTCPVLYQHLLYDFPNQRLFRRSWKASVIKRRIISLQKYLDAVMSILNSEAFYRCCIGSEIFNLVADFLQSDGCCADSSSGSSNKASPASSPSETEEGVVPCHDEKSVSGALPKDEGLKIDMLIPPALLAGEKRDSTGRCLCCKLSLDDVLPAHASGKLRSRVGSRRSMAPNGSTRNGSANAAAASPCFSSGGIETHFVSSGSFSLSQGLESISSVECGLCHSDRDLITTRLPCGHYFHDECILEFFTSASDAGKEFICPVCNSTVS